MNEIILLKEHEAGFHTSEDWAVLKDRCSECFKASKSFSVTNFMGGDWKEMLGRSIRHNDIEDLKLSPDPRN